MSYKMLRRWHHKYLMTQLIVLQFQNILSCHMSESCVTLVSYVWIVCYTLAYLLQGLSMFCLRQLYLSLQACYKLRMKFMRKWLCCFFLSKLFLSCSCLILSRNSQQHLIAIRCLLFVNPFQKILHLWKFSCVTFCDVKSLNLVGIYNVPKQGFCDVKLLWSTEEKNMVVLLEHLFITSANQALV